MWDQERAQDREQGPEAGICRLELNKEDDLKPKGRKPKSSFETKWKCSFRKVLLLVHLPWDLKGEGGKNSKSRKVVLRIRHLSFSSGVKLSLGSPPLANPGLATEQAYTE